MLSHLYKIRILIAFFSSTIVLISSVYNVVTATVTKTLIHEIILEERRQLELTSNPRHSNGTFRNDETTPPSPCNEGSRKYHIAANRMLDKKDIKKNEIDLWDEIEQALSPTKNANPDTTTDASDQPSKAFNSRSKPKRQTKTSEGTVTNMRSKARSPLNDTAIIITTNWMPSVPSTAQLDKVINSLNFLNGLPEDAPMIIAVDGAYEGGARYKSTRNVDMRNYIQAIKAKYNNSNNKQNIKVITSSKKIMLVRNMKRALRRVHTKYVLVLQHDLPFINQVNHTGLIDAMEKHPEVRLVRFPTARVLTRTRDGGVCNEEEVDFESENGIQLTKTHVWSDRYDLVVAALASWQLD